MAYNRHRAPARHLSVTGSGSSHSCLDGVPFKVSPSFRPLPQPGLPSELLHGVPRSALHDEYDYDTEEGVLAWARAREEAKIKAMAERQRAERARAALAAAESSSSSESEDEGIHPGVPRNPAPPRTREAPRPPLPAPRPPWQLPLAASAGGGILTPMPIQTVKAKAQSPLAPQTRVDLALFEQEGDPFDNLELQTIDDMEELRTLLEGVSAAANAAAEVRGQDPSPDLDPDAQPTYSNTERVGPDSGGGGSSRDKIYVNVTVRSGTEVTGGGGGGGGDRGGEGRDIADPGSAMERSRSSLSSSVHKPDSVMEGSRSSMSGSVHKPDPAMERSRSSMSSSVHKPDPAMEGSRSSMSSSVHKPDPAMERSRSSLSSSVHKPDPAMEGSRSSLSSSGYKPDPVMEGSRSSLYSSVYKPDPVMEGSRSSMSGSVHKPDPTMEGSRSSLSGSVYKPDPAMEGSRSSLYSSVYKPDPTMEGSRSSLSGSVYKPDPNCDFVIEPTGDGDYVMIRSDYSQRSMSASLHDSPPSVYANLGAETEGGSGSGSGDPVDPQSDEDCQQDLYTNSQAFMSSSQPPVLPRVQSLFGDRAGGGLGKRAGSVVFNPAVRFSLPRTSAQAVEGMDSRMTQSAYVWSESSPEAWSFHPPPPASSSSSSGEVAKDSHHTYSNLAGSDSRSVMTASTPAFSNVFYSANNNNNDDDDAAAPPKRLFGSASRVNRSTDDDDDRPVFPGAAPVGDSHMYSNLPACSEVNSIMTVSMPAFSNCFYGDFAHQQQQQQESEASAPACVMSPTAMRNARSNPDLSAAHGSHPSPQPWNPYKPLPPTPVSDLRSSSSSTESLPTEPTPNPSPLVLSPSPSEFGAAACRLLGEENDPYHRLSTEAKAFVNKLTSMGFSRSRASRAVEKFGNDEREVLDHMFNVDKLMEKKFSPSLAEMSLQLFKNDMRKAEQFLDLFQQFRELGFTSERIQTALVKHELDRDKALDYLTT